MSNFIIRLRDTCSLTNIWTGKLATKLVHTEIITDPEQLRKQETSFLVSSEKTTKRVKRQSEWMDVEMKTVSRFWSVLCSRITHRAAGWLFPCFVRNRRIHLNDLHMNCRKLLVLWWNQEALVFYSISHFWYDLTIDATIKDDDRYIIHRYYGNAFR